MNAKTKHKIILFTFLSFAIPFVIQKSIYPFFRMGMYAEKVSSPQKEFFYLAEKKENQWVKLSSKSIGVPTHYINYLGRNHFYRGEMEKFILSIRNLKPKNETPWALIHENEGGQKLISLVE